MATTTTTTNDDPTNGNSSSTSLHPPNDVEAGASWNFDDDQVVHVKSDKYTGVDPPAPELMAQWAVHETVHDIDNDNDNYDGDGDESDSDHQPMEEDENDIAVEHNNNTNNINDIPSHMRHFMGPRNDWARQALRRRKQERTSKMTSSRSYHAEFESVCYRQIDTPVWHNTTQELGTTSVVPDHVPMGGGGRCCRWWWTRVWRCLAKMCGCTNVVSPIRRYLAHEKLITRLVLVVLGIGVSMTGFLVEYGSVQLLQLKITKSLELVESSSSGDGMRDGFTFFLGLSLIFGFGAVLPVVAVRPVSAGSGIAEAKAVLNGIVLPQCTELTTALCKAISVVFTSAASMPVGLEGPMIFMGLSLGENAQRMIPPKYVNLLSDRNRRDFAAVGTACGVSSAFRSPIGGVLFAMEEGSSFWSVVLAWKSFGAACVTAVFSYLWALVEQQHNVGARFDVHALGKFHGLSQGERINSTFVTFSLYDYLIFALLGIAGGIIGSVWCEINRAIAVRRNRWVTNIFAKCLMVLVLVAIMASLVWWIPTMYQRCTPLDVVYAQDRLEVFRGFGCPDGEYNQLATLLLNPPGSVSINLLFWEPEEAFDAMTCLIAGSIYLVMLLLCFGTSVSMGIFIPLLYAGACFGRAVGVAFAAGPETRTYAIVGSIALLAGVVRVLISLTTIMITCTGLPYMVTPFMVATILARSTGQWLTGRPGIYDIILELKGIPFLEEAPPDELHYHALRASDVMSSPLVSVQSEMNVGALVRLIKENSFMDFPMTNNARDGKLVGLISRVDILTVLSHPDLFYSKVDNKDGTCTAVSAPRALKHQFLVHKHFQNPTLPSVEATLKVSDDDKFINLIPYANLAHYTFDQNGSAPRAYELFRLLGLRTMVVTGASGLPVGIISRHDLKELETLFHQDKSDTERGYVAAYQTMS